MRAIKAQFWIKQQECDDPSLLREPYLESGICQIYPVLPTNAKEMTLKLRKNEPSLLKAFEFSSSNHPPHNGVLPNAHLVLIFHLINPPWNYVYMYMYNRIWEIVAFKEKLEIFKSANREEILN